MGSLRIFALAAAALFSLAPAAHANVGEAFGFGSRSAGMAGVGTSNYDGAFSAYSNPAALSTEKDKRLTLSWGLLVAKPTFTAIDNVKLTNNVNSNTTGGSSGSVDMSYKTTLGQELALAYRLFPDFHNLTFGVVMYLPLEQLAYLDTGPSLYPEYVLYRARTQRPQFELGLGAELGGGFHLGLGLHVAESLTTNADFVLQTKTGGASSLRLASSLKPRAAPYLGAYYSPESPNPAYSIGAVVRLPVSSAGTINIRNDASVIGANGTFNFLFNGYSALYYDPLSVEVGTTIQEGNVGKLVLQLEYQAWGKYESPALIINNTDITSCTAGGGTCPSKIQPSINPDFDYRDIIVPRIGQEFDLGRAKIRLGYSYRPSILGSLPTGNGNYLDPPKHIFTAGFGYLFSHFLGFETPCALDLHATYEALVTQHIEKTAGNENGDSTDSKIGAPGYDAGGSVYGGGASITLAF